VVLTNAVSKSYYSQAATHARPGYDAWGGHF
jgi:hypothetical protein